MMKPLFNRLYSDYAMPSRLALHEEFVLAALRKGYAQTSVRAYFNSLQNRGPFSGEKFIVHRHDIDTDLRTTRKLFEIEKKYNITSSFYFRLSTLDIGLMQEIEDYGSEASYHYEELATFAKQHKLTDPAQVLARLPEIREIFFENFHKIEQRCGRKLTTVASHGDLANRRLKLNNTEILKDPQLRARCGIVCESYDRALLDHIDLYIADRPHPQYFYPSSPFDALGQQQRICLLTHPRQWETNWVENTKDNLFRLYEGLTW